MTSDTNSKANTDKKINVALALSGGIDSAVAAMLLMSQGYNVTCYFMQCWPSGLDGCRADSDYQSALAVATYLKLPLHKLDFIDEYRSQVFSQVLKSVKLGETPNPDVLCNSEIKFKVFADYIRKNNPGSIIATGHYASVIHGFLPENYRVGAVPDVSIGIPTDMSKDQSYYLSRIINLINMSNILFPLSDYNKSEVRLIAKEANLPNYDKPDSQGLCFIGDVNFRDFISKYVKGEPGRVVDSGGNVIGTHLGLECYTIGQRHGFAINKYSGTPLYVISKNTRDNTLIVGQKDQCYSTNLNLSDFELLEGFTLDDINANLERIRVRIRSLGQMTPLDTISKDEKFVKIRLKQPIYAPAPGQYAVLYLDNAVIGSGIISKINN